METTERATVIVPKTMLAQARQTWPETEGMNIARLMRFALVIALTGDRTKAIAATRDARIGTKRNPSSE